ncbi:MAG: hypothetical protein JRI85_14855 [Deltaproteobacteria bacterium]|nr:hypothetical protein [Deltaproteobacteria bacterium]
MPRHYAYLADMTGKNKQDIYVSFLPGVEIGRTNCNNWQALENETRTTVETLTGRAGRGKVEIISTCLI